MVKIFASMDALVEFLTDNPTIIEGRARVERPEGHLVVVDIAKFREQYDGANHE